MREVEELWTSVLKRVITTLFYVVMRVTII